MMATWRLRLACLFLQAEDGIRDVAVTGVQTCALPINDPQYIVQINREKAKSLLVPFSQITDALQVYMGSVYVNDFDFNNRSYRVYVQADSKFRSQPKDIREYYLRSDTGKMISLDNLVTVEQTASPQVIRHYNLRSEEHTSELQSRLHLVCRLLLEKKHTTTHLIHSC